MEENTIKLKKKKETGFGQKRKFSKRTILSFFIILIAIPLTIWFGWNFGDRKFYITSLLIIVYTMIPFFVMFEKRKPQARELVILAVMCAIAIASRTLFIWAPNFKPMTAIIIITGVAFGPEAGFLAGAVSGFVSNFIFGQGPWTPWQMFAFGMAGFLAGLFYQKGLLSKKRIPLCIFGGIITLCVVGLLLDICSLFTMATVINWESFVALMASGFPVNLLQSVATILTLLLVSQPMFAKLDRVKKKYGMMEE